MKIKPISGIWLLLLQAIGINVSKKTVWQMTADGMHKVEEEVVEYFGPVALCNYGGRPVLSASQLAAHSVGTGDTDVVWWPIFDSLAYPSAGQGVFAFYSNPIGQGTSSAPGVGAVPKTINDTNLQVGNQLTSGNEFFMIGSESNFSPGVSNANLPLTVLPGRSNVPTTVGYFINDIWSVGQGGIKTFTVGTDRKYFQDGPMALFPPSQRLAGFAAMSNETSTTGAGGGFRNSVCHVEWRTLYHDSRLHSGESEFQHQCDVSRDYSDTVHANRAFGGPHAGIFDSSSDVI
jgi:hypothetical protein